MILQFDRPMDYDFECRAQDTRKITFIAQNI